MAEVSEEQKRKDAFIKMAEGHRKVEEDRRAALKKAQAQAEAKSGRGVYAV